VKVTINPECCYYGPREAEIYKHVLLERKRKYDISIDNTYQDLANNIDENGYAFVENFFSKDRLQKVIDDFEEIKENNELQYEDFYTEQVAHPLLNCQSVFDITFDSRMIEIAKNYFGCLPAITGVTLRKSKETAMKERNIPHNGQTTLFHCDKDSPRFLKFFIYLNDVGKDNGPFTYVHKSHIDKFQGWRSKYRWSNSEIEHVYGKEKIKSITGKVGDLVMGNTAGFHKGTKVKRGERLMLTIYFSIHPTEWRNTWGAKMQLSDYKKLPDWKKPITDYINKV
jgi:ectoine hydroxylase-related dioxygenase (phytanoyl-CoA dioxygenase family)|tara:strand:- start:4172 stop:5020 length:849 start_codon:yes stop_codon:yes gene_type:complete